MKKQHQEMIHYLSEHFPNYQWIRVRRFWKTKRVEISDQWFSIWYHNTIVFSYNMWNNRVYINFWDEEFMTNSTACIMKDMVEWILWWQRLPKRWWVIDEHWLHWIFTDECKIEVNSVPLSKLKL